MSKLPQKGQSESRAFAVPDIRAQEDGNVIDGHAAVFGQPYDMYGWWEETISRGAFDGADLTDVLFSINHDLKKIPLARSRNNNENSTLQLKVDDQGLSTRAVLDVENNAEAKALYGSIARGDISGMSYIFRISEDVWTELDSDYPKREITKIAKVYEVSAVSLPANAGTDINARDATALDGVKAVLENARRSTELDSSNELEIMKLKNKIKANA